MEFYDVIDSRRSIREFVAQDVEKEKLLRILDAGLKAPSHDHLRDWEFILIKDPEQRRVLVEEGAMAKDIVNPKLLDSIVAGMTDEIQKAMFLKSLPIQKSMLMNSPELLVVCFKVKRNIDTCETLYELSSFASIWACIENILLAITTEGLAGVTYIPKDTTEINKLLELPQNYEVAAMIPIGYPAPYEVEQPSIDLNEKIHIDRW